MLKISFQENGTWHAMMSYQHVKTSCPTSCQNSCFNKMQPIHVYRPNNNPTTVSKVLWINFWISFLQFCKKTY